MSHYDENKHDSAGIPDPLSKASPTATSTTEVATAAPVSDRLSNAAIQTQCQSEHDREIPEADLMSPLYPPRHYFSQPDRNVAHVHVFRPRRFCQRLPSRPSGQPGDERRRACGSWKRLRSPPRDAFRLAIRESGKTSILNRWLASRDSWRYKVRFPASSSHMRGAKPVAIRPGPAGAALKRRPKGLAVDGHQSLAFQRRDPVPTALTETDIECCIDAWETAARRALEAGFKVIELHAAHGYLMHEFLSPLVTDRSDNYGGSLANRMRLLLRLAGRLRDIIPPGLPFFVRISATDLDRWRLGYRTIDCSLQGAEVTWGGSDRCLLRRSDARCEDSRIKRLPDSFRPTHPRGSENPTRRPGPDYRSRNTQYEIITSGQEILFYRA